MANPEGEKEFWEHLEELRWRIIRSIIYAIIGAVFCWYKFEWIYRFLLDPVKPMLSPKDAGLRAFTVTEGFVVYFEVCLIAGAIIASPFIFWEIWQFISPALFKHEKRYVLTLGPSSFILFFLGVLTAYYILPIGLQWLMKYGKPLHIRFDLRIGWYLSFVVQMFLAFGALFELPLVLVGLSWIGLISYKVLKKYRRHAIVIIFAIAAIVTPSIDWISTTILAVPLCLLYELSIWLVWLVERGKARREAAVKKLGMPSP